MIKTILVISIFLLVNSQDSKADCSKIDQIIKDVDVGLKLSKIKTELQSLSQFSQELESATLGFRAVLSFIKKLKDAYEHKVLLQTFQAPPPPGFESKQQPKGPNSPQKTYDQLASALSEIRAVSRMFPEIQKAEQIFETMRDDINTFRQLAKDLNVEQKQIDTYLKSQNVIQQCKGSQYVLHPNIYESSSSDEEEVIVSKQAVTQQSSPKKANDQLANAKNNPHKDANSKDQQASKTNSKHVGKQSLSSHHLGKAKSHNKHNEKSKMISVKKRQ